MSIKTLITTEYWIKKMTKWQEVKLGDIISIKHGYAFKGEGISDVDNGIVLVTPGNFAIGGGFQEKKCKFFIGEYPAEYILNKNDLIVTMTDLSKECDTLGYSALVPNNNKLYLHNQRIGLVEFKSNAIDKYYLYWYMRTKKYQHFIVSGCSGSVIKHTSPNRICATIIHLPPLDIQKKIAGVLGALDDKIELNNKINQNLEAQAQALFKSLYNMENNGTLNDIIDTVETGNRPKGGARSYGIPSIGAENIEKFGVYDYSKEKFIDKDFYESMKRGKVKSGDVLLYKDGAYTGKVSLALDGFPHKTCAVNEHVFIIRGNPQISSQFFIYFCLSNEVNKNYLHTLASSKAAQPGLNQAELLSLPIFIPPIDLLKNFTNNVSSIMHKIAANALENVKLSILRDTLLPKLMNGEIDVDNVKID